MDLIDVLGLDRKSLRWQDLALCQGQDHNLFFELYEDDPKIARQVDAMCAACPVKQQCLQAGLEIKAEGVRGGYYLNGKGSIDKTKLGHKSPEEQARIKALL